MKIKKSIFIATAMILLFLLPYDCVKAAEKEVKVDLDKDYVSCIFNLSFENAGEYEAVLTDSNGNTHEFIKLDDTKMTCSMDKTPMGTYTTHITNGDNEADIGKVTLTVSTNNSQTTDIVDNNIKIGRNISGLKMYFKDNKFISTWSDETCGAVNVKVVNLDTAETIKNEKVTDRNFECEIDDTVKQIEVSIVPASSSSIKGAELTYNFDVYNYPDATVKFPDVEKTNQDKITVKVDMGNTYSIYVEDNDECVLTTDMMVKGTYDIDVPLCNDGKNDLMFYIVDSDGNMRSTFKTIYKDTVAPSLSLSEEYDGIKIDTQQYTISGNVSNYDTLSVNGKEIIPATDGYFENTLNLHWGENTIYINAADDAGNETSYNINIIAEEPENSIDIMTVIFIVVAIGILIFLQVRRKMINADKKEQLNKNDAFADDSEKQKSKNIFGFRHKTKRSDKTQFQTRPDNFLYNEDENNYEEVNEYDNEEKYEEKEDEAERKKLDSYDESIIDDKLFDMEETLDMSHNDMPDNIQDNQKGTFIKALLTKKKKNVITEKVNNYDSDTSSQLEKNNNNENFSDALFKEEKEETDKKGIKNSEELLNKLEIDKQQGINAQPQTVINIITNQPSKRKKKSSQGSRFIGNVIYLCVMVCVFYLIFQIILITGFIKSSSMEPTLMTGDFIVGNRLAYKKIEPERGDIILFNKDGEILGKRVIGIPGDVITFNEGKVYVNSEKLDESEYLSDNIQTESDKSFEVPDKHIFVLGDNRENSYDSRYWESETYVAYEDIVGKLLFNVSMPSDEIENNWIGEKNEENK